MKKCPTCLQEKELSDFPKDKSRNDGRYIYCRDCVSAKEKEKYNSNLEHSRQLKRQQATKHRERNIVNSREWYQQNKEKVKQRVKKYRQENSEAFKEYQKQWSLENPDKIKEKQKRFLQTPKGRIKISQQNHNRKARIRGAKGKHTAKEWNELKAKHDFTCLHCKKKEPMIKLTQDHIIPVSKGGDNFISNIQPLCKSCNSKKHNKI